MTTSLSKLGYIPDICPACKQSCTYVVGIDHSSINILKAIAQFVGQQGLNAVHPRHQMEGTYLTSSQIGNLSRLKAHDLIAPVKGIRGTYQLTQKGLSFLKGEPIPRYVVISKAEGYQVGYLNPETLTCRINDYSVTGEPIWGGIDFDIVEGQIIKDQAKLL